MTKAFTQILLFWLLGETLHYFSDIPISGNVLGMLLLFIWLMIRQELADDLERASHALISQLSLLLLPGGVGLFFLGERMQGQWLPLLVAVVVGTLLSILICLLLMQRLMPKEKP